MALVPTAAEVAAARRLLRDHLPVTRLVASPALSARLGAPVSLKLECELPTGSFKPRGAIYALATRLREDSVSEVVASSSGNHGAAVAYAARLLGVPATIFLPENPNPIKRAKIAELGATIVETGPIDLHAAALAARAHAEKTGAFFLNDATDEALPAGPATIACDILEQAPGTAAIWVPMGDTALIRGMASAAKRISPSIRIVGVQAEQAPAYVRSWREGRAVTTETCDTIADGLATRVPEPGNVEAIRSLVDDMKLVGEEEMIAAVRHLLLEEHVVAEPSGAATTAAAVAAGALSGPTVLLVSGANLAPEILARVARAT
jgi:threonine dehydratase